MKIGKINELIKNVLSRCEWSAIQCQMTKFYCLKIPREWVKEGKVVILLLAFCIYLAQEKHFKLMYNCVKLIFRRYFHLNKPVTVFSMKRKEEKSVCRSPSLLNGWKRHCEFECVIDWNTRVCAFTLYILHKSKREDAVDSGEGSAMEKGRRIWQSSEKSFFHAQVNWSRSNPGKKKSQTK